MNYSTAIFLINDNARAIRVQYEPKDPNENPNAYIFKTLDKAVKLHDYVVIPTGTRHGMTVVKVVEVNVNIDLNSQVQLKWIIARVDRTEHERIVEQEEVAIEAIKVADFEEQRAALRQKLSINRMASLKMLELSSFTQEGETPSPTPAVPDSKP